ncbi:hydrogenase expression/formation C-terminal domain-containing protein [Candidatus Ferrigenium straubiae]|jgi:hydrogenase-1 operon protein HyaF|uniref:hydrogenase expression/formation C-terminal domain-containing protein n=1 Tax=Candidatus Ferrigenium straubiae TaxID=2919506 RepID=UPI003F4AD138
MAIESVASGLIHGGLQTPPHSAHKAHHPHRPIFWMRPAKPALTVEAAPGTSAQAIASEIEVCAARFAADGEDNSIDLRFLKAMPQEREALATLLGQGEVSAVVSALGRTEIRETAIPCVWWVRHHNEEGEIVGELIEITAVPEIITGDRMAVARGLEAFRSARRVPTAPPSHNAR